MPHRNSENRFRRALSAEEEEARRSREAQRGFDAGARVREAARGAFDFIRPDLEETIGDIRGSAVGAGRLDTGFLTEDEDRAIRTATDRLNSFIATQGLQAAGLDLRNIEGRSRAQNRFLEALTAQMDREQARRNAQFGFDDFLGQVFGTAGAVIPFL